MLSGSSVDIYKRANLTKPLCQGEILSNVRQVRLVPPFTSDFDGNADDIVHSFAIILTQDCDLEQDEGERAGHEEARKQLADGEKNMVEKKDLEFLRYEAHRTEAQCLTNIILCTIQMADTAKSRYNDSWNSITKNDHARFQFLTEVLPEEDCHGEGIPSMVIDFRHCFAIRTDELLARLEASVQAAQRASRRTVLAAPFMQQVITRYASHISRVALDIQHWTLSAMSETIQCEELVLDLEGAKTLEEATKELDIEDGQS